MRRPFHGGHVLPATSNLLATKGPSRHTRYNGEAQFCDRGEARRGNIAGRCDRGATTPRTKDGPPRRAGTILGCTGVAHRLHTPGMRALRSLAHSKIVSANCTGYVVTDPNPFAIRATGSCYRRHGRCPSEQEESCTRKQEVHPGSLDLKIKN